MTNLMRRRAALIEVCQGAAGDGLSGYVTSVEIVGWGSRATGRGREGTDADSGDGEVAEEVDVQVLVRSFAQRRFHVRVEVSRGPVAVDGEVGADEGEADAVWVVASV